jgi:hypothetical protein
LWRPNGLENESSAAHILMMTETQPTNSLGPPEFINGRRIQGYTWGWVVDIELVNLAKFPGQPLTVFRKFDTLELAREAALRLGPIKEIDESEYDPSGGKGRLSR